VVELNEESGAATLGKRENKRRELAEIYKRQIWKQICREENCKIVLPTGEYHITGRDFKKLPQFKIFSEKLPPLL
jgi:hypothetical protein